MVARRAVIEILVAEIWWQISFLVRVITTTNNKEVVVVAIVLLRAQHSRHVANRLKKGTLTGRAVGPGVKGRYRRGSAIPD